MAGKYSWLQRFRIHQKAKRKLGHRRQFDAQSKYDFMATCMDEMMQSGEADGEDDARDVCELLWNEMSDVMGNGELD